VSGGGSGGLPRDGGQVLEALGSLPGGAELLELAATRPDVALVGGAARDLLLARPPRELDVVLAGGAAAFAHELASRIAGPGEAGGAPVVTIHDRFGTAAVAWEGGRIDIAERRAESYPAPGALPEVRPGSGEEDLARRDFTVNAIAIALAGERRGSLESASHALEDLLAARLRVLHDESFIEDPTRLLRLARYSARLGFQPEQGTAALASQALAGGALATVSAARIGAELRLGLGEPDPLRALQAMSELGVLAALRPALCLDEQLARRAQAILPADGRADLLLLAQLLLGIAREDGERAQAAMFGLLDELEFPARDRDRAIRTALDAPGLQESIEGVETPSRLRELLRPATIEAVALAAAMSEQRRPQGAGSAAARRWLEDLRHVRLSITGDDLLAAGVPAGPEIGRRLELALARKLDGELSDGREAELSAATEGL
jgi:tRNA nucleotidyltransferase (CCA-adding enzyme)